ncbi:MAG: hypothetical protein HY731_00725 [Candidatus Tectomicrobia bacterium]|nr:hypothetical protein [Candidatus Tectomicrobia bacterium]
MNRYFWIAKMTLMAIFAFVLADIFLAFLESMLEPIPERNALTTAEVVSQRKDRPFQSYTIIQERNIFDSAQNLAPKAPPPKPTPPPPKPVAAPKERVDPKLKLVGTVVGRDPASSYAIIEDLGIRKQQLLRIGEKVSGAELVSIERQKVTIRSGDEEKVLFAFQDTKPSSPTPPVPRAQAPPAPGAINTYPPPRESTIKEVAENVYEVPREEVTGAFANVNELMTSVRLIPHFEDGLPAGFRIGQIRNGSFLEKIGIRNGDVLKGINGLLITTPEQAFRAYQELQSASTIRLDVLRDNQNQTFTYQIK